MTPARPVIGWREWVGLPDLGVEHVKAKVDTGARSSSLHAHGLELVRRRGRELVRFEVHPVQRRNTPAVVARAPLHEMRQVRSSTGETQLRPVILTRVRLLGEEWEIELTLTKRDVMGFRMLLGRQAIRRRFVVDPGRSYLGGRIGEARKKKKQRRDPCE